MNLRTWAARIALFGLIYPFVSFNLQAEIWIGMQKGELFKELGAPISTLAAGRKELHNFTVGRKVEILDGRVVAFSGFPEESIIEVEQPTNAETPKASIAYTSSGAKPQRPSEFIDFKAIEDTPQGTSTLSNAPDSANVANKLQDFLESNKATTLYILGGGVAACLIIAIAISFSRSRKAIPLETESEPSFNREIPPFLQSTPQERPSLNDPRGDTTDLREERLAMREDPNSLGLSIRATPYQDFDSTELRGPLVSQAKESGVNAAYSNFGDVTTTSAKPTRKTRDNVPKVDQPSKKRSSSLKLESH